jgi:WD40 repeat protein
MNKTKLVIATLFLPSLLSGQGKVTAPQHAAKLFPEPDFILRDRSLKRSEPQKSRVELSNIKGDGKGGTTGTITIYGGSDDIQVGSLSFSGDGKVLAVGSTRGRVDLWNLDKRKKLRTLEGGSTVGLSLDGRLLAKDGKGIELCDVASGKLRTRIPWVSKRGSWNPVERFAFSPDGALLDVSANGEDDTVYGVSSGKLVATLTGTRHAQFSKDGSLLVGGTSTDVVVWNTKDWTMACDVLTGPDFVTRIAAFPEKDLVIEGAMKLTSLMHLRSGKEISRFDVRQPIFAAFNRSGKLIFTYSREGLAIWDLSGMQYCSRPDLGNSAVVALSPDDRWLAAARAGSGATVMVWDLQKAFDACGIPDSIRAL